MCWQKVCNSDEDTADAEHFVHAPVLVKTEIDHPVLLADLEHNMGADGFSNLTNSSPKSPSFAETVEKKKVIHLFPNPQNLRSAAALTKQSVLTHLYGFARIVFAGLMENRLFISLMILSLARQSSSGLRCTPISSIKSSQIWTCLWNLFVPTLFWSFLHNSSSNRLP